MKIVVLDGYTENPSDLSWEPIACQGELTVYDRTSPGDVISRIGDAEAVFTNKTPLTKETLEACPSVKFVGVLATGYNVVDVAAAKERNVTVCNVPAYGTAAVAQHVFALLLELCHRAGHHSDTVHAGRWGDCPDFCYWDFPLMELAGKTMGVVGYGNIGKTVAGIAKSFGMTVLACGSRPPTSDDLVRGVTLEALLAQSDVISLHCPLTDSNRGMIHSGSIAKMKDGVILINTARGPLIVEEDLRAALESGKVAGAGLDVLSTEPPVGGNPLLGAPNCIITPHIAWAPKEARARLMDIAAKNLSAYRSGAPINVVNS